MITLPATMAFARGWEDLERFGKAKKAWLSKFLKLEQGIPPHDVYPASAYKIPAREVEKCFMRWVRAVKHNYEE